MIGSSGLVGDSYEQEVNNFVIRNVSFEMRILNWQNRSEKSDTKWKNF